jgi:hypothetical protein
MRQVSLRVALPSLVVFAVAITFVATRGGFRGVIFTSALYAVYAFAARQLIASNQQYGMQCFDRHSWLDDWRGLFLCSSSPISYREIALLNQAFCYNQIGNKAKAFETYRRCLERFPSSTMAEAALRMMEAARSEA